MQKLLISIFIVISFSANAQTNTAVLHNTPRYVVSESNRQDPDTFSYKGNLFENVRPAKDTTTIVDPETGMEKIIISQSNSYPARMNGEKIYDVYTDSLDTIRKFIKDMLINMANATKAELNELNNGYYTIEIDKLIIDKNGKPAYYEFKGIVSDTMQTTKKPLFPIDADLKTKIDNKLVQFFNSIDNWPLCIIKGTPSPYRAQCYQTVYVYDHRMRL